MYLDDRACYAIYSSRAYSENHLKVDWPYDFDNLGSTKVNRLAGAGRLISKLPVQNSPKAHYVVEKQKGTTFVVRQCLQENMLLSGA